MVLALVWTEPTTALRDWLRGQATITALCGQRIYAHGLPDGVTYPALEITRISGGPDLPIDRGLYQFDCWAATGSAAKTLVEALIRLLYSTPGGTTLAGAVRLGGIADSPEITWAPDPESNTPRYAVTAQVATRTTN